MTIFLLLPLVLVFSPESTAAHGGSSSQTVPYDELQLALQWPTSFCNTGIIVCNYHPIPPRFTVHGLWKNTGCKVDKTIMFDRQINRQLKEEMVKRWPNLRSREDPEHLWIHEFRSHGYCFADFPNQEVYYTTALEIEDAIGPVLEMRLSSGKILKSGNFYHVNEFRNVTTIHGRTLTPRLRCNWEHGMTYPQLQDIVFCSDRKKNLKDCTFNYDGCFRQRQNSRWNNSTGYINLPRTPASLSYTFSGKYGEL